MPKSNPEMIDDENPEWTDEMFARARPAAEVLGAAFMEMAGRSPGRPKAVTPKAPVTLRFDADVAQHLRGSGKGWQTRLNDAVAGLIADGKL